MSLNCTDSTGVYSRNKDSSSIEICLFLPPPCAIQSLPDVSTVHCKVSPNSSFNFSIRSSNFWLLRLLLQELKKSCRSVLVMNLDISKQQRSNGCGSMSGQLGTLTFEFTTDLGFGLAFATGFPVLMDESIFSLGISSDVSVTYLLIPFTMPTHEIFWFSEQCFDHDVNATTSFVRIEFHTQDWTDLRTSNESTLSVGMSRDFEIVCIIDKLSA